MKGGRNSLFRGDRAQEVRLCRKHLEINKVYGQKLSSDCSLIVIFLKFPPNPKPAEEVLDLTYHLGISFRRGWQCPLLTPAQR